MDWPNERYVRLYNRVDADEQFWPWEARAVFPQALRRADRAGLLSLGKHDPVKVVAKLIDMPVPVVATGLAALIEDGCIVHRGSYLIFPNYIEANEANQTEAQRKRESRARARDRRVLDALSGNGTLPSGFVTDTDQTEDVRIQDGDVTEDDESGRAGHETGHSRPESGDSGRFGHNRSQPVTTGHSVPCRAVPYRTEEEIARVEPDDPDPEVELAQLAQLSQLFDKRFTKALSTATGLHPSKGVPYFDALRTIARWLRDNVTPARDAEGLIKQLLDGFFANANARSKKYPIAYLATNPIEYFGDDTLAPPVATAWSQRAVPLSELPRSVPPAEESR